MVDASHAGRTYPPTPPHLVTRAEIDAFARALGAEPAEATPPTFAMRIAAPAWQQLFDDAELGLALERTIHADQAFDLARPLREGDEVTATLRIDKVRPRGESDFVTLVVDLAVGPEVVATSTSTFVCARGVAA